MTAIDLLPIGKMEESISTGVFRNKAHIEILKERRKIGFTSAVDIIIDSIDYNLYENGKLTPPIQFYGYAVLVFQDCLSLEIPIKFPRQRIYYAVQHEAIRQWRQWVEFYTEYQLHRKNDLSLALLMGIFEVPYEEFTPEIKDNEWIELPLREVHVRCQNNTQFKIEHTQWQPIKFNDPFTGIELTGESKQEDGDKDEGLPANGIQASRNPPSNPFGGNVPVSGAEDLGYQGLGLLSDDNLQSEFVAQMEPNTPVLWVIALSFSPPNQNDGCGIYRPAGETRTFEGVYSDSWTFPDCNPRAGLNGFCINKNGTYMSEAYVCSPTSVSFDSITPYPMTQGGGD